MLVESTHPGWCDPDHCEADGGDVWQPVLVLSGVRVGERGPGALGDRVANDALLGQGAYRGGHRATELILTTWVGLSLGDAHRLARELRAAPRGSVGAGGVMPTLWIIRGLPASGKTVWARERVDARLPGEIIRLSRDDLGRMALPTGYHLPVDTAEARITHRLAVELWRECHELTALRSVPWRVV